MSTDREDRLNQLRKDYCDTECCDDDSDVADFVHQLLNEAYNHGAEQWSARATDAEQEVRSLERFRDLRIRHNDEMELRTKELAKAEAENIQLAARVLVIDAEAKGLGKRVARVEAENAQLREGLRRVVRKDNRTEQGRIAEHALKESCKDCKGSGVVDAGSIGGLIDCECVFVAKGQS